ncbi:MAG: lipid A biosynthesis acyltransferase, partial [Myxococcota bacterium]
ARFPTGPFMLASILQCPIYLTFGIFREPNLYQLSCEPFAERLSLPRRGRDDALREHVQRYARALEAKARSAPDNWFNFYDFWEVS